MQQRGRGNHQHPGTLAVAGRVQQQAEVAAADPAGLQDLAVGVDAKLPQWPAPGAGGWGGAPGYPANAPPSWGALPSASGCRPQPHPGGGCVLLDVGLRQYPLIAECGTE